MPADSRWFALWVGTTILAGSPISAAQIPGRTAAEAQRVGLDHSRRQQFDETISDFTEAIRHDPKNAASYQHRADAHFMLGHLDKAIRDYTEAIFLAPDLSTAYRSRGLAWMLKREPEKALPDLTEAIRMEPRNGEYRAERGVIWIEKKEFGKAIEDLDEAIRLDSGHAEARLSRGVAYMERHEYERAIADLDEAIRLHEAGNNGIFVANALIDRARVRCRQGRYDQAIADYSKSIRLGPRDARSYDELARIRATCPLPQYRDGRIAVDLATRACELSGWSDPKKLATLAAAHAESGDYESAVKWQTKANGLFQGRIDKSEGGARLKTYRAAKPYHEAESR